MYLKELKNERHVSPSSNGSEFDRYNPLTK